MTIRHAVLFLLMSMFPLISSAQHASPTANELAARVMTSWQSGTYEEALAYVDQWIALTPENPAPYSFGTIIAVNARKPFKAVEFAKREVELAPSNVRALTDLAFALRVAGDLEKSAEIKAKAYALRKGDNSQSGRKSFMCDDFDVKGMKVAASEFFDLEGPQARKYQFAFFEKDTERLAFVVSFGSYEATNRVARELGTIKGEQRVYHLDRYLPDHSQQLFGMYDRELTYDEVKPLAIKIAKGEMRPVAGLSQKRAPAEK